MNLPSAFFLQELLVMTPVGSLRAITLNIFCDGPKTAGYFDMDSYAKTVQPENAVSPFLAPAMADGVVAEFNRVNNVDCSYGGRLEDRSTLWRGLDLIPSDKAVHEGVDVNVPAGTALTITRKAKLVKTVLGADLNDDQSGGWGSVLFFQLEEPVDGISHFLYAHLAADDVKAMQQRIGETFSPGDFVARTGTPEENGGWFAHLHVQAFSPETWEITKHGALNEEVWGYSAADRAAIFPDPTNTLLQGP